MREETEDFSRREQLLSPRSLRLLNVMRKATEEVCEKVAVAIREATADQAPRKRKRASRRRK